MNVNLEAPTSTSNSVTQADWEQWSGNWIWRAVLCLVDLPGFNPSPKWIANRLNIGIEKAVEAIEGLERLGCIKRTQTGLQSVSNWIKISPENMTRERILNAHSRIAPQLISKLSADDAFTSNFFIGDKAIIKKYSPRFMKLFKDMSDEALANKSAEVIAVQMSFVQLTGSKEESAI